MAPFPDRASADCPTQYDLPDLRHECRVFKPLVEERAEIPDILRSNPTLPTVPSEAAKGAT
jgi:hypothetical protein